MKSSPTRHVSMTQDELRVTTHCVALISELAHDDPSLLAFLRDEESGESDEDVEAILKAAQAVLEGVL